jgi:hypothetical protein
MKAKTIKAALRKKIDEWVESIEIRSLREAVTRDAIVTGGSIASMLLREPVNDFDVYFATKETTLAVAEYYCDRFKPTTAKGITCPLSVRQDEDGRVRIVIKSAGIASEDGTAKPYEYFEGRPAEEATGYVGEVMHDSGEIQDTYERKSK